MKKSILALALAIAATSAFAGNSGVTANTTGNINVTNSIGGNVTVSNGGFSQSQATNSQTATIGLTATTTSGKTSVAGENVPTTTTSITGVVGTSSNSTAWNYSTGNANGSANSTGGAGAVAWGNNVIPDVSTGSGSIGVGHTDSIKAGTNQGGYTGSVTSANFGSSQTYINGDTTSLSSTLTGSAVANNASGNMVLNSGTPTQVNLGTPGTISVGDSGYFNAVGAGGIGISDLSIQPIDRP